MSRQCLYCASELPKGTASNFCSKECWTEYKKLKSMNVDADKQATVLLKRTDLNSVTEDEQVQENKPAEDPGLQESAPEQSGGSIASLRRRLDQLERDLRDHVSDFENMQEEMDRVRFAGKEEKAEISDDVADKISHMEQNLHKVDELLRNIGKFEDRLISLEKRLKTIEHRESMEKTVEKKGFFARLFG